MTPTRPRHRRTSPAVLLAAVAALVAALLVLVFPVRDAAAAAAPTGLHVSGNQLLTGSGAAIVLRGVDRSGTEYQCIHDNGIFEGPNTDESIAAMTTWKINTVRVPLNEDCWLGVNAPAAYSGPIYRSAIIDYVNRLHAAGLVVVLDLHWTAPGSTAADGQRPMPDVDHSPEFWSEVAAAFKADTSTVFDLFNEPYDVSWTCWRDGGDCGIGYQVAGMQSLVDAVRRTGATNPVLVGGLGYGSDLSQWQAYRPTDPTGNLMASWHSYKGNGCSDRGCWDSQVAPVAAAVPLVAGEVGQRDCAHDYLDAVLPWLDDHHAGYQGWGWDVIASCDFPPLIDDYDGHPTAYGIGLRDHLAALATPPTPTPTPTGGGLTVTPSADTTQAPYFWEDRTDLVAAGTVTALTVTIRVVRTTGIAYNDQFTTAPNGAMTTSHSQTRGALVYTAKLVRGQTLPAGYQLRVAAQFTGTGTAHATSGDTYQIVGTVGGKRVKASGHF